MRNMSEDGIAINNRFFEAIHKLIEMKQLRGLQTFSNRYGLNQGNFNSLNSHRETLQIKTEYIAYIVRDYNVSAEWILFGTGNMFNQ